MASPSAIITIGFGNGTFDGSPSDVVRMGYGSADVAARPQAERFDLIGPALQRYSLIGPTLKRHDVEGPHPS